MRPGGRARTRAVTRATATPFMLALLFLAASLTPVAGAAPESSVSASAPVVFEGAANATTGTGTLLVGSGERAPAFTFRLEAARLNVTETTWTEGCAGYGVLPPDACLPGTSWDRPANETHTVTLLNATVVESGPAREDLRVAWTVDREHRNAFPTATPGVLTLAHEEDGRLGVKDDDDWQHEYRSQRYEYDAPDYEPPGDFAYAATPAEAAIPHGWSEVFLFDADVTVRGTREDNGDAYERTIRTGTFTENEGDPEETRTTRHLVLEAADARGRLATDALAILAGDLNVTGLDRVVMEDANGTVRAGDRTYRFDDETARIAGPVDVTPLSVDPDTRYRDRPRVTLAVNAGDAVTPAGGVPVSTSGGGAAELAGAAVAAAAVTTGLAGAGAVAYYWPRVRWLLTVPVLPLYTRIARRDVLNHGKREEIYGMIREEPGIHAHEISGRARLGWGTTVYHLRLLEDHRLVVSKRVGRYRRFYVTAGAPAKRKHAYAALRNETTARVADYVMKNPGLSQKDVCHALGISPSLASWHVKQLEEAELVKKVRDGRRVHYYAGPAWNDIDTAFIVPTATGDGAMTAES